MINRIPEGRGHAVKEKKVTQMEDHSFVEHGMNQPVTHHPKTQSDSNKNNEFTLKASVFGKGITFSAKLNITSRLRFVTVTLHRGPYTNQTGGMELKAYI